MVFKPDFGETPEINKELEEQLEEIRETTPEPPVVEEEETDDDKLKDETETELPTGYPKTLYNAAGESSTVNNPTEEAYAKRAGYTLTSKPAAPPSGGGGGGGGGGWRNVPVYKLENNQVLTKVATSLDVYNQLINDGWSATRPSPAAPKTLYKTLFKRETDGSLSTFTVTYQEGQDDDWKQYLTQGWFEADPGVPEAPFEPVKYNGGGTWYKISGYPGISGDAYAIEYTLDSGRKIYYLASESELNSMFGEGQKPSGATVETWSNFSTKDDRYFGGAASEIIGNDTNFSTRVTQVIQSGGTNEIPLPDFVKDDEDLLDIFFVAIAEGKSESWLLKEFSKVQAFKDEYPGIDEFYKQTNDWKTAINSWNNYNTEIQKLNVRYGETVDNSDLVEAAVKKGYTIEDIQKTYEIFEQAERNSDFLTAFQSIIDETDGVNFDVTSAQGIVEFFEGKAPTEIYDIYEAASIQEQATRFELGINAESAIQLALATPGQVTQQNIASSLQSAAIQIARVREDINLGRYGLTEQALVNAALGIKTPGISEIEIQDAMSRIFQENQELQKTTPFNLNDQNGIFTGKRDIRSV